MVIEIPGLGFLRVSLALLCIFSQNHYSSLREANPINENSLLTAEFSKADEYVPGRGDAYTSETL